MKKTIKTPQLKQILNEAIRNARGETEREALKNLAETILTKTGTYNGFNYNYWIEKGCAEWNAAGNPDEKDRFIYGNRSRNDIFFY